MKKLCVECILILESRDGITITFESADNSSRQYAKRVEITLSPYLPCPYKVGKIYEIGLSLEFEDPITKAARSL